LLGIVDHGDATDLRCDLLIRPDGTVIVRESTEIVVDALSGEATDPISKWEDIET
jgi:hypothetical protein